MKKLILGMLVLVAVLGFSNSAFCEKGPYVGFNLGMTMVPDSDITDDTVPGVVVELESDTGIGFAGALGYDFGNNFRVEGEVAYQSNEVDKVTYLGVSLPVRGDVNTLSFLVNGYYDFKNDSAFTPFVSVGAGFANVEADDFYFPGSGLPAVSDDDTVFAYQIGAGVGYAVSKQTVLEVKYRYFGTGDPGIDTSEYEYSSHNIYLGLRFSF